MFKYNQINVCGFDYEIDYNEARVRSCMCN